MPPLRSRSILLVLLALVATALAVGAAPAAAAPVVNVAPDASATTTGTSPFDSTSGPGQDASATDDQVRTYDTVTFGWTINVNSSIGATESYNKLTFTQTLPAALRWDASNVPLYCKGTGWNISSDGLTLTCVYVPTGAAAHTGQTLNFQLVATAREVADGTLASPAPGSTTAVVDYGSGSTSPTASSTAPDVTVRSAPSIDMYKTGATGSVTAGGYYISYTIGLKVPQARFSAFGLRGFETPDPGVTFVDDYSSISPNATFVSCSTVAGLTCFDDPLAQMVDVAFASFAAGAPNASNGSLNSATIKFFVPSGDVTAPNGVLATTNRVTNLSATAESGNAVLSDADSTNNAASYSLVTQGGSGNGSLTKRFLDQNGNTLPTQANSNDGNGQVRTGQTIVSELQLANSSATAPVPAPAVCDVWDATRLQLSATGPGPAGHSGAPAWAQTVPSGWTAGTDYVIEYGTQAAATGDDATRWSALKARTACDDGSDTWSATAPSDPSTVTKVRVRFLRDLPAAVATLKFRINLKVTDTQSGDLAANFLGRQYGGGAWTVSDYNPLTHAGFGRGDRVRINGVTVSISKRASNPSVTAGQPATILSGGVVQFELKPKVTGQDIGTGAPVATDVVVQDRLPLGLTWDDSQATAPSGLTPTLSSDGSGRQILTWHIASMTAGAEPVITYWVKTATTAIGTFVNDAIIGSAEDLGSFATFPSGNPTDQHISHQTLILQSPGGVQISKAALQAVVEPDDTMGFTITYANLRPSAVSDVDVVDVLPFDGDDSTTGGAPARTPATAAHGSSGLSVPVAVTAGETVKYTDADPSAITPSTDPNITDNAQYAVLPAGHQWCVATDFGTAGCPSGLDAVTAVRVLRATLASGASGTVTLTIAPHGDRSGDVYANTAAIRYGTGNLGAVSNVASSRVVASRLGDYVWSDENGDGIQDSGEPALPNVPVTLTGTDKHGRAISVTSVTDAQGRYVFTSSTQSGQDARVLDLVSGSYVVTFDASGLPAGTVFTTPLASAATTATDSDADPATGRSGTVVLPDPSPTGADGENLTVDAGVVLGHPAPPSDPVPPTTTPDPAPAPPVVTPPAPPAPAAPAVVHGTPRRGTARLSIASTPSAKSVKAGDTVVFSIKIKNTGTAPAHDAVVCTTPAKGLTVTHVPKGATLRGGQVCWKVGTLPAGAVKDLKLTVRATTSARRGGIRNVAAVKAKGVPSKSVSPKVAVRHAKPSRASDRPAGVTG